MGVLYSPGDDCGCQAGCQKETRQGFHPRLAILLTTAVSIADEGRGGTGSFGHLPDSPHQYARSALQFVHSRDFFRRIFTNLPLMAPMSMRSKVCNPGNEVDISRFAIFTLVGMFWATHLFKQRVCHDGSFFDVGRGWVDELQRLLRVWI